MYFYLSPLTDKHKMSLYVAGSIFFLYASSAALLVQLVILPYFLTHLHAGHGLLQGGDWVGYHHIGVNLSNNIHEEGWVAWQLRPLDHSAAGIAAIFYTLFAQEPYVLIPLNALVHALAGIILMIMVRWLTNGSISAFIAAVPFVFFPSALAWYAQIGKDGFYFTGGYFCVLGWVILARISTWKSGEIKLPVLGVLLLSLGIALMGVVRIYAFQLIQGMGFIFVFGMSIMFIFRGYQKRLTWKKSILAIIILTLVPLMMSYLPKETRGGTVFKNYDCNELWFKIVESNNDDSRCGREIAYSNLKKNGFEQEASSKRKSESEFISNDVETNHEGYRYGKEFADNIWEKTGFLPNFIEVSFLRISVLRQGYIETPGYKTAGSMLDNDVSLTSVWDFVEYFPRALQIGFLAPFPREWVNRAYSPGGGVMRIVSGVEMCIVYFSLLFLPYALWIWRHRVELWIPISFSLIMILTYSYATPNMGSLYRLRYGFLMIAVAFGIAGFTFAYRNFLNFLKK